MRRAVPWLSLGLAAMICVWVLRGRLQDLTPATSEQTADEEPSAHRPARSRARELGTSSDSHGSAAAPGAADAAIFGLEGQVIDAEDAPVAGALVSLLTDPPRSVQTGPDGTFVFTHLRARDYRLAARADALIAGPLTVSLRADTPPLLLRLARGSSMIVRVLDQRSDTPIGAATVELDTALPLRVTTDALGQASLTGLAPSLQAVRVSARGFESKSVLVSVPVPSALPLVSDVRLRPGASLCGHVADTRGADAADAEVRLERSGPLDDPSSDVLVTDERGRFCFEGVARGSVRVAAQHAELGTVRSGQLELDGVSAPPAVELTLVQGARLRGQVLDVDGSPVARAEVRVVRRETGANSSEVRKTRSSGDGSFSIAGLDRGRVSVVASFGPSTSAATEVELASGEGKVELRLRGDQLLRGIVTTRAGEPVEGAQVAASEESGSGKVRADDGAAEATVRSVARAVTDADGSFTLTRLRRGSYRVRASRGDSAESAAFWRSRGVVARTGAGDVKIVLEAESTLRGRVQFEDGAPAREFTVALPLSAPVPFRSGEGAFELKSVPSGVQSVTIAGAGITPKFLDQVRMREGAETDLGTVRVQRARRLTGIVTDEQGAPLANASVHVAGMLLGDGADVVSERLMPGALHARTDQAGRFAIETLPRTPLVAIADHETAGRSATASIPPEQAAPELALTVFANARLSGQVTRRGRPAARAYVVATMPSAPRARWIVQADRDGAYRFEALAGGSYLVSAATEPGADGRSTSESVNVELRAGVEQKCDLTLSPGDLTVDVHMLAGGAGSVVPHAQAYLLSGSVSAAKAGELELAIASRGAGTTQIVAATGGEAAHFESVSPGSYSFCAIPIYDDISDPVVAHKLNRDAALLPAACVPLAVAQAPTLQQLTVRLP